MLACEAVIRSRLSHLPLCDIWIGDSKYLASHRLRLSVTLRVSLTKPLSLRLKRLLGSLRVHGLRLRGVFSNYHNINTTLEYRCLSLYTFHWHWYGATYGNGRLRDAIRLTISSKSGDMKWHVPSQRWHTTASMSENMKGTARACNTRRRRTLDGLILSIAFLISC